jgi:hypothetical protein
MGSRNSPSFCGGCLSAMQKLSGLIASGRAVYRVQYTANAESFKV